MVISTGRVLVPAAPGGAIHAFAIGGQGLGVWPDAVARLYGISAKHDGAGQSVGIVALGGGYLQSDLAAAAVGANRPFPFVIDQSVNGATNIFGGGTNADEELALDVQVLAGLVPAARIVVYFTTNTQEGLASAIRQAALDDINRPSVLSISWGSAEAYWHEPARNAVQAALEQACMRKMTVVAAAGDYLATAGELDGNAHVCFPGSSPLVLCCGGTSATLDADLTQIETETVWNDGLIGSGGGISDVFAVPDYQQKILLPPSVNDGVKRRGVPDVAAIASRTPGYRIVLNGKAVLKDGTSAATPLWSALVTLANAIRGQPLGMVHSYLYSNPSLCRQIILGSNRVDGIGYDAGPGWSACSGLGVPAGGAIISALAAMP